MSTKTSAIALAALLGTMPIAFAAQPAHPTGAQERAEFIQPDQIRASKMIGSSVYDLHNRKIGKVQDLILDRDGKIDLAVVDVGSFLGMGGKNVAVKPNDIKTAVEQRRNQNGADIPVGPGHQDARKRHDNPSSLIRGPALSHFESPQLHNTEAVPRSGGFDRRSCRSHSGAIPGRGCS